MAHNPGIFPLACRRLALAALAAAALVSARPAHAVLERVGPPSSAPDIGGFPAWYQDTTGLTLEFCAPTNASEVEGGWCLLLPGDVTAPEAFPNNFFDEHFYFAASAAAPAANGARALLVLAQEAAFAIGPAIPGDQIVFSRIRVVLNPVPVSGTYRFIHPYGEESLVATEGDRIFFTEDIGFNCSPGDFSCALHSRLGPFLLPSATPGGPEMPPLTASNPEPDTDPGHFGGAFAPTPYPGTGKAYIADPARIGPVTGSPLPAFTDSTGALRDHNIFRIEGPAGSGLGVDPATGALVDWVETTDFSLMGRVYTSAMPGRVEVARASYTRTPDRLKLDVFARAFSSTQSRLPAQPRPAPVAPLLTFFDAPCDGVVDASGAVNPPYAAPAGAVETQMFGTAAGAHWGQAQPAALPAAICVKDGTARDVAGNVVPSYFPRTVTDEVKITEASWDPGTGTMTVAATSSDTGSPPVLTLAYGTSLADLSGGRVVVPGLVAPPENVRVLSTELGTALAEVTTGFGAAPTPVGIPVAVNDAFAFAEDAGPQNLVVLANDQNAATGTVSIESAPRLGTAVVNADGSVTYTASANASGTDSFTYSVTVGAQVSNTANVTLDVTPANDAPVAVGDSRNALQNRPLPIAVLSNDTDADGAADLAAVASVTQPTDARATVSVSGKDVIFTSTATGTFTFTYRAQDAAGAISASAATVTVAVSASETIAFARSEYTRSSTRLRVEGTVRPAMGQTMKVELVNSAGVALTTAGAVGTDAAGAWSLVTNVPLPTGATAVRVTSSNGTAAARALTFR